MCGPESLCGRCRDEKNLACAVQPIARRYPDINNDSPFSSPDEVMLYLWWIKWRWAGFLVVLRFPLPIFIPPVAPHSSSIIRGWYNMPVVAAVPSGLSLTPQTNKQTNKQTPWLYSANELYRPSDRRLSAKLVPILADRVCRVVSATNPHGR
jgi:hypothetical protein